jgi:hypothetical protein
VKGARERGVLFFDCTQLVFLPLVSTDTCDRSTPIPIMPMQDNRSKEYHYKYNFGSNQSKLLPLKIEIC